MDELDAVTFARARSFDPGSTDDGEPALVVSRPPVASSIALADGEKTVEDGVDVDSVDDKETSLTSITCSPVRNDSTFVTMPDFGSRSSVIHLDLGTFSRIVASRGSLSNM